MGEREMVLIGRRGGVVAQLDCPSSRLIKFGNLQAIFPQTVIKLRGSGSGSRRCITGPGTTGWPWRNGRT